MTVNDGIWIQRATPSFFHRPATPQGSPHFGAPRPERSGDPANPGRGSAGSNDAATGPQQPSRFPPGLGRIHYTKACLQYSSFSLHLLCTAAAQEPFILQHHLRTLSRYTAASFTLQHPFLHSSLTPKLVPQAPLHAPPAHVARDGDRPAAPQRPLQAGYSHGRSAQATARAERDSDCRPSVRY